MITVDHELVFAGRSDRIGPLAECYSTLPAVRHLDPARV
jgi:hypothetical protein